MKSIIVAAVSLLLAFSAYAGPYTLNLKAVPLNQVVVTVYGSILSEPYMLDDAVKNTPVTVSFANAEKEGVRDVLDAYLNGHGIQRVVRSGVNIFLPGGAKVEAGQSSPVQVTSKATPEGDVMAAATQEPKPLDQQALTGAFLPTRRSPVEIVKILQPLVGQGGVISPVGDDGVLVVGDPKRMAAIRALLGQFDKQRDQVMVKASVVEYSSTNDDGIGFFGALQILGGKLGFQVGDKASLPAFLNIHTATFQAVVSAISQDSRFSLVDSTTLRIHSGKQGRINVGADVPILGAVSIDAHGNPVQSIQYRPTGLIVDLKPVVLGGIVETDLTQSVSSVAVTNSSRIDSPTMLKREFSTSFSAEFNDVVFIGGLDEIKDTETRGGVFGWRLSDLKTKIKTTIFLVLEFTRV